MLGLLANHLDELATAEAEVHPLVLAKDGRVMAFRVLHGAVNVALEHRTADALPVVRVFIITDANSLDRLRWVEPEGLLLGVKLFRESTGRFDVPIVLEELNDLLRM